jgi:hypothetical protein
MNENEETNSQSTVYELKVWAEGVVTKGTGPDPETLR